MAPLCGDLPRRVWDRSCHVREQFSGRQDFLDVQSDLERVQTPYGWCLCRREASLVPRHRGGGLRSRQLKSECEGGMQDFNGKVAVITGAASGIGLGCARTFARAGMKIALCDLRTEPLKRAVESVRALGAEAIGIPTDVSKKDSVEQAAEEVVRALGKIHIAMN